MTKRSSFSVDRAMRPCRDRKVSVSMGGFGIEGIGDYGTGYACRLLFAP